MLLRTNLPEFVGAALTLDEARRLMKEAIEGHLVTNMALPRNANPLDTRTTGLFRVSCCAIRIEDGFCTIRVG